jgi:predicted Zn finger-like uncharacterized protein
MRYLVADGAVGPDGRKVRCAHCHHEWWQSGEDGLDEALFGAMKEADHHPELDEEIRDQFEVDVPEEEPSSDFNSILQKEIDTVAIPQGVRPVHDDLVLPTGAAAKKTAAQRLGGFLVAALFYVGLFALFLLMHEPISRAWPATNLIYNLVGLNPVVPGEGLTLAELDAKMEEDKITLKGDVINLRDRAVNVPTVLVSIVGEEDKILDQVLIAPPVKTLEPQGRTSFNVVYPKVPDGAVNVNFAFSYLKAEASAPKAEPEINEEETPAERDDEPGVEAVPEPESSSDVPSAL